MKITYKSGADSDGNMWDDILIETDSGKTFANHVRALYECPEDAIIGRDLVSCGDILEAIKLAYEAGKNGEEFYIVKNEEGAPVCTPHEPAQKKLFCDIVGELLKNDKDEHVCNPHEPAQIEQATPNGELMTDTLFDADPNCKHNVVPALGGGVKCTKCRGWFCY